MALLTELSHLLMSARSSSLGRYCKGERTGIARGGGKEEGLVQARAKGEASRVQVRCRPLAWHLLSPSPLVSLLFRSYSPLVLLPFPWLGAAGPTPLLPRHCFLLTESQRNRSEWIRRFWRRSGYMARPATVAAVAPCGPATWRISSYLEQSLAFTARTEWRALPPAALFTPPSTGRGRGPGSGPERRGGWAEDCRQ
jgi:hypothetical protein